jgi:hypothetical protein
MLAQLIGRQGVFRVSLVPGVDSVLAGFSNLVEDGLQLGWAFWPFILGTAVIVVGLVAFTGVVVGAARGRVQLLAAVPVATLLDVLFLHDAGGGVLVLAAWLPAVALIVGLPTRTGAPAAPTSP